LSRTIDRQVIDEMKKRIIRDFMDLIILAELRTRPLSGYDIISFIHKKHHLLVSAGTVYSLLYSLERHGLVEGTWFERKRIYKLTEKGSKKIEAILSDSKTSNFLSLFISEAA